MNKKLYCFRSPQLMATALAVAACCICLPVSAGPAPLTESGTATAAAQQSKITVKGSVKDADGPVVGASVVEKGTTNGVAVNLDGEFTLSVHPSATLVVSGVGYETREIKITAGRTFYEIVLTEDAQNLDEVVVVGYGVQKKVNLSGSVSTVNVSKMTESRPVTNISQALAGAAAGLSVVSANNQPGNDNASITVRGQGTLNSSAPLVIIDGVEAGINSVSPSDIESLTVLKDASSAAIYGSRAANGVILITTKHGETGRISVDYNGYVSFSSIRKTLTPVSNYADYMELVNEGYTNSGKSTFFSQEAIDTWRADNGRNPLQYPNTDWIDETFRPSTATNHTISLSGGSDKMRVYASAGYQNSPGVMENAGYTRYSGRINFDADVRKWLNFGMQVNGYVSDMGPAANFASGSIVSDIFTYAAATTPGMVFRAPDGRFGAIANSEDDAQTNTNNPLARAWRRDGNIRKNNLRTRFTATVKPVEGFSVTASYSYELTDEHREWKPVTVEQWNFQSETVTHTNQFQPSIYNYNGKVERFFNDVVARYAGRFADNRFDLGIMAGASQELYRSRSFNATKYDLIDPSLGTLGAATGDASASGSKTEWAMHSYFGRVNLAWDDKYLAEFNLRADGSSRFLSNKRWGYFPSGSVAWRIDREAFMKSASDEWLSNLKLRASYGSLGNNSIGNYEALALYSNTDSSGSAVNYPIGGQLGTGLVQKAIPNSNLTWETTRVADVGLDFGFLNNRLTGTFDWFNKHTTGILINLPAPGVHGIASIPNVNSAEVTNTGFELTLGWHDRVKDFTYGVNANFTYVTNNVDKFKGTDRDGMSLSGASLIWEGHAINSQYMLCVDRILQTDDDMALVQSIIDNAPVDESTGKQRNPFAAFGTPQKGDLLYKDMNGDGIIDNDDKVIVSDGRNPKYLLGLTLDFGWKGIDFSMLIQGSFGASAYWQSTAYNTPTVRYGYQINKAVADGRWYEGRTDATYPRLLEYSDTRNQQISDFYLENLNFLKIRNIQLGYTLPKRWTDAMSLKRVRVYASLENYITITNYKGFDPEVSGMNYPTMKQAVLGINITF